VQALILTISETFNGLLAAGAVVGGVAYAFGQWISARKRGGSDALHIAVEEVSAIKIRVDRLEIENKGLRDEISTLHRENQTLRGLLTLQSSKYLDEALAKQTAIIKEEIGKLR
jgi:hypothetical protein